MSSRYRSVTTNTGSGVTSLVINKPAGVAVQDILVCYIFVYNGNASISGFTEKINVDATAKLIVLWRRVDGTEGASFTIDISQSSRILAAMLAYPGAVVEGDPFGELDVNGTNTTDSLNKPADDGSVLTCVFTGLASEGAGATSWSTASGMTERADLYRSGLGFYDLAMAVDTQDYPTGGGTTGTKSSVDSLGYTDKHALALMLLPYIAEAELQGVATMDSEGSMRANGEALLQGVGEITSEGTLRAGGEALLQGIGSLSAEAFGTFTPDYSRYDAYIEDETGVFGVLFHEGEEGAQDLSRALQPTRSDVGNNPFEIRPESGNIFSQGDFSHGANQRYYHHADADAKKYLRSEGFDISEPGKLSHLHATTLDLSDANVGAMEVANGIVFVVSGQTIKKSDGSFPGSWSDDDPHVAEGAGTVYDIAGSGQVLYAALGSQGIHKRVAAGTWSHWSACAATRVAWVKNRIMAADGTSIYEIASDGTPGTAIETLPDGWLIEDIFEAGEFVYAACVNANDSRSRLHIYGMNSGLTAIEKKGSQDFPFGQLVYSGSGYLGNIFLGAGKKNSSGGYDPVLYRAAANEKGFLDYIKVADEVGSGSVDLSIRAFLPLGEQVVCGWSTGTSSLMGAARAGLAVWHLPTEAFAHHLKGASSTKAVKGIVSFKGRLLFSVADTGVYAEDVTKYVTTATLITSVADWNNAGGKLWDLIELSHGALPTGTSIEVEYATEVPTSSTTWKDAINSNTAGSDGEMVRTSSLSSRLFALKLTSSAKADQSVAPEVHQFSVRSNPDPDEPEYVISRFIRLGARERKDEQAEEVRQDVPSLRRRLLGLAFQWVTLYEPDDVTWVARVENVKDGPPMLPKFGGESFYIVQLVLSGTLS